VVKSGDVVRVKVLSVDIPRHRISLTLRLDDEAATGPGQPATRPRPETRPAGGRPRGSDKGGGPKGGAREAAPEGALADALRRAGLVPKAPRDR
jgi:protein Tex